MRHLRKNALVTGFGGQDATYLASWLGDNDYNVLAVARSARTFSNMQYLETRGFSFKNLTVIYGDVTDANFIYDVFKSYDIHSVYNLAAQSHVGFSFENPVHTMNVNYAGAANIINAIRMFQPSVRLYQAGTSELFGYNHGGLLDESAVLAPRSPYAISKLAAHWAIRNARHEGIFACNGILFNHESPIRGPEFVTRKISRFVAKYARGLSDETLRLGNLDARRDWGHAYDYVKAMVKMMEHGKPDDYVIASGESHSVRDFVIKAFDFLGFDVKFSGEGENETGSINGRAVVCVDPKFYRPNDVNCLTGDASKAKTILGWQPSVSFDQLVSDMVRSDIVRLKS